MGKKTIKKKKKIGKLNKQLNKQSSQNPTKELSSAIQYHKSGQLDHAIQIYQRIIRSQPNYHPALNLIGLALFSKGQLGDALPFLFKAATLSPEIAKYHYDLGVVLQSSGKDTEAINHYRSVLELEAGNGAARENLGVALFDSGLYEEAVSVFEKALKINPESDIALTNLANLRRWGGEHRQGLALLNQAIQVSPANALVRLRRAEIKLSLGDFIDGWKEYSWRFLAAGSKNQDKIHFVPVPKWDGHLLKGKTLLIHTEQGIGDEVMFASCLPDLLKQGTDCHLICDQRMVSIFRKSFPGLTVSPNVSHDWGLAGENVNADLRIPIGELPKFYRPSVASFKSTGQYLKVVPELFSNWQSRLEAFGGNLKIGISWRGGAHKYNQKARSIALTTLAPLLSLHGVTFFNLQYGDFQDELKLLPEDLQHRLISFSEIDPLIDLENFSALIANLDLVISVDNSTVHFAGALGVPTWLLLPALGDWRWPVAGADSRWYPSVQLIRQQHNEKGDWAPVIDRVNQKLSLESNQKSIKINECEFLPTKVSISKPPLKTHKTSKALLLNDTSFCYHWGCTCTSIAIRENLKKRGYVVKGVEHHFLRSFPQISTNIEHWNDDLFSVIRSIHPELYKSIEQAETVVVNGEGSLHSVNPISICLLYLMYIAKTRFGKPVHIINHSCYPDDQQGPTGSKIEDLYRSVYTELDHVAVREPISSLLLEQLGINVTQSFDCLPLFVERFRDQIQHKEPKQIIFAGSVAWNQEMLKTMRQLVMDLSGGTCRFLFGANAYPAGDDIALIQQFQKVLPGQVELVYAQSEIEWLSAIASAKLLVSGRFHHSIAAACLNTPFIVLDSNTPKISGLMQTLDLETHISSKSLQFGNRLMELSRNLLNDPDQGLLTEQNYQKILSQAENNFIGLA